ncbi:hypothetical protein J4038_14505 [Cellulomonas sp. zg-ZUI40]|nr:hypothetical protein [Cellulomonas dongxiuzhuiae]
MTVELKVVAAKEAGGKAGFKVPFVDVELGGSGSRSSELTSTITVVFGSPVDYSTGSTLIGSLNAISTTDVGAGKSLGL